MLTHLPLDNMTAIWADDIFKCIFVNKNYRIPIQFSLTFVPRSPIDNKPLPKPVLTQFIDAYMRDKGEIS